MPPNSSYGAVAVALPLLGTGLGEIPLEPLVWGLGSVALGAAAFGVGWEIGSAVDHTWLKGLITDTGTFSVCGTWRWVEVSGDPFGIGHSNYSYLHAMCGYNNADTFAASPHSSGATDMAGYEFWHDVINYTGLAHGTLYAVSSTYCNGSSPCYVRADALSDILPLTGPYATEPPGMGLTVTSGWADPSTGKGVTSQAWPYGSGPSTPAAECKQAGVLMPCSSVSSTGGPVQPAYGWPSMWPTNSDGTLADGFVGADQNDIRCVVSASFACPQTSLDGTTSDWGSTGGPKITMPDCYGDSVSECEVAIDDALAAAGSNTTTAFTTTVAPTYVPSLPDGVVTATILAANTVSDASTAELEINESTNDGLCDAKVERPHTSITTPSSGVLAKGWVRCQFTGSVTVYGFMWACSSKPAGTFTIDSLNGGAFGCATTPWPADPNPTNIDVSPGAQFGGPIVIPSNVQKEPNTYYIAAIYGPQLRDPAAFSQVTDGS